MHAPTILTSALTLLLSTTTLTSAATIAKARRSPQDPSAAVIPSYTLTYTSVLAGTQTLPSDGNGDISVSLAEGDVLNSVAVNNPADNADCVVRDAWGNQIRAFGGPGQDVDSVEFVFDDGKQARSIACSPAF